MLLAQFKEVKEVFILEYHFGPTADGFGECGVEVVLAEKGLLVGLVLDLVDENAPGPPHPAGHAYIKLPLKRVFAPLDYDNILAPRNFCNKLLQFLGSPIRASVLLAACVRV